MYKTSTGPKPLRIRFDKIDGFIIIIIDGKIKHLILFDYGLFNKICDRIKYLISKKSGITNSNTWLLDYDKIHKIIYLLKKYRLFVML